LLADSPVPWLVEFNGLIVDARTLPSDVQAEARRKRLIPDLDPESGENFGYAFLPEVHKRPNRQRLWMRNRYSRAVFLRGSEIQMLVASRGEVKQLFLPKAITPRLRVKLSGR
jgi:hypothetical protein